ncbi:unnamed protein product, partial [Mesorhabditis belari]|uniref:Uncharacterized protein n=1 Tax=Mesorhabditis belari TaxID=2138241 RepID=A0AAF3FH27_9BILA
MLFLFSFFLFPLEIFGFLTQNTVNGRLAEFRQVSDIFLTGRSNLTYQQQLDLDLYEKDNKIVRVPFEGWPLGHGMVFYVEALNYYSFWDLLDVFFELRVSSVSRKIPHHCPNASILYVQSEFNEILCRVPYSMNNNGEMEFACRVENPKRYIIAKKSAVSATVRIPCDYMNNFVITEGLLTARYRQKGLPCNEECRLAPVYAYTPEFGTPKNIDIKACTLAAGTTNVRRRVGCYDSERTGLDVRAKIDEMLDRVR